MTLRSTGLISMTSGRDRAMRHSGVRPLAALALLSAATCTVAAAQPTRSTWGLPQLMHSLAQVRSARGHFTERKTMHLLKRPIITSGTLTYRAPDRITKITLSPVPQRFSLKGDQVTISGRGKKRHVFSLGDYPQIGGLVEGIRATLAGNLPTLRHYYHVRLVGRPMHWTLVLRPKGLHLTDFVKQVRITGAGNRIRIVDTLETNGDQSEMCVSESVHRAR